ncbi:hypothetical protein KQI46_03200 [Lysinibacillus capsici]|uniref:hypothetical protein n=1 Tax=Lysinibacillus capsici TaxID=2115968 RepID=UPI001C1194B6|nr:hypothetical protein [Lysinibacillus capsici]MBU5250944.1 hypothetical protein [Lysinibacillus capsici]
MKKIFRLFLASVLFATFSFSILPENAQAASPSCDLWEGTVVRDKATNTFLERGNLKHGACHIEYYHMAAVGKKSAVVDGIKKSQFSQQLAMVPLVNVAGNVVANGVKTKLKNGNMKAEAYDSTLKQHVRVIYYVEQTPDGPSQYVVSMYPYK